MAEIDVFSDVCRSVSELLRLQFVSKLWVWLIFLPVLRKISASRFNPQLIDLQKPAHPEPMMTRRGFVLDMMSTDLYEICLKSCPRVQNIDKTSPVHDFDYSIKLWFVRNFVRGDSVGEVDDVRWKFLNLPLRDIFETVMCSNSKSRVTYYVCHVLLQNWSRFDDDLVGEL